MMAWRWVGIGAAALAVIIFGFSLIDASSEGPVEAQAVFTAVEADLSGYARAIGPWDWQFPRDFGPHPEFQTEWWYYTGNVRTDDGRRFGYQFTIFRRAITPEAHASASEWRSNQLYMAHFALADVDGGQFLHQQRYSRAGAGLAGATVDPRYRVWLEDWEVIALDDDARLTRIVADAGDFAVDLTLEQIKPPALQGEGGLSPKSEEPGNASYYYSLSRLLTAGTITVGGQPFAVSGATWKDHEFSTSALGPDAQGWDWFGLHLDDGRELMLGRIRLKDGDREPAFGGLLVEADGRTRYLPAESFTLEPTSFWTSPHTGAQYPANWRIQIDLGGGAPLNLTLTPLLADQELHSGGSGVDYWEGAVRIGGDVTGYGYAELTGYVQEMAGRF